MTDAVQVRDRLVAIAVEAGAAVLLVLSLLIGAMAIESPSYAQGLGAPAEAVAVDAADTVGAVAVAATDAIAAVDAADVVAGPVLPVADRLERSFARATFACPSFRTWQDWLGGARVHASVSFRATDICEGRYVKRAYVRIIRSCGPYLDSGRIYTSSATSRWDSTTRSVRAWMFDSVLWRCVTRTYYGYEFF